jgi:HD-GYP domain-containing protein (c-di-GMP phosphodiesterase class II)
MGADSHEKRGKINRLKAGGAFVWLAALAGLGLDVAGRGIRAEEAAAAAAGAAQSLILQTEGERLVLARDREMNRLSQTIKAFRQAGSQESATATLQQATLADGIDPALLAETFHRDQERLAKIQQTEAVAAETAAREASRRAILFFGLLAASACIWAGAVILRPSRRSDGRSLMEQVMEALPIGVFVWGGGQVRSSNPAFRTLFGVDLEQESAALESGIRSRDLDEILVALDDVAEGREREKVSCRLLNPAGLERKVDINLQLLSPVGREVIGFIFDRTEELSALRVAEIKTDELDLKNKTLEHALTELEGNLESMVTSLVRAVEAKDPYTAGHSQRVSEFAQAIGADLGLSPYELKILEIGMLIHDVGKIGVPDHILTKPGPLTPEEFLAVKAHPVVGAEIIARIPFFSPCLPVVRWHHEKLDGSGYPDGISGESVPFLARIAAVADIFDAMTSRRSYRRAIPVAEAMRIIEADAGAGRLDFSVVAALRRCVRSGVIRADSEADGEDHWNEAA